MYRHHILNFIDAFGLRFHRRIFWLGIAHFVMISIFWCAGASTRSSMIWYLFTIWFFTYAWYTQKKMERNFASWYSPNKLKEELEAEYERRLRGLKLWKKPK